METQDPTIAVDCSVHVERVGRVYVARARSRLLWCGAEYADAVATTAPQAQAEALRLLVEVLRAREAA